ncbi:MAG: DUF1566 domain-containing protein [Treponema sp.]|jgi:hypothetical protein|nr:DUF1566 domain-containing protein [Treponema sp.]
MKSIKVRFFCMTVGWTLLCAVLSACGGSPAPVSAQSTGPADELDAAIREASTYLNGRVPGNSKAVFLNIKSDYPDLSEYILSVLSENAVNDGVFSVVDRQQLDTIRAELNFQMSGEVSDESAQSIGQMLGAQSIVSGAVSKLGSLYRVQVKAIEVQSAGVQGQWSRNVPNGATIAALTERFAPAPTTSGATANVAATTRNASSGGGTAQTAQTAQAAQAAQTPAPEVPKTYKIGDKGPAGGFIFYDRGNDSDGWRYLEAAPASTEGKNIQWAANRGAVSRTNTEAGTGKQNTQTIMNHALQTGENMAAARLCDRLQSGGYDDWYLPSKVELGIMYLNLKMDDIGGFGNDWYWSSSEGGEGNGAWSQNFNNGEQNGTGYNSGYGGYKLHGHNVRAIRQF